MMLEDVSPAGRSGSSSSAHHLAQQQHHHFQQQQQQSEDIKRDLSDMCQQQEMAEPDESDQQHKEAQYLSANCVVFMSYSGDTASVVDQHFSRALNQQQDGSNYSTDTSAKSSGISKSKSVRLFQL